MRAAVSLSAEEVRERVREVMRAHVGQERRIRRRDLTHAVFGYAAATITNNNSQDRAVRDALSALRVEMLICTSSTGGGGYWIADSQDEAYGMAEELRGRALKMIAQSHKLEQRAREVFGAQGTMF